MGIKESTIQRVRGLSLTSILEAEKIPYKRVGREALTLCPWHNDSNPSLTLNDDKGICFCFACGGGSDAIAYVQQKFSLGFADAVLRIAEKQQILVEYDDLDPEEALRIAQARRTALERVAGAQATFRANIRSEKGEEARQWLLGRGITPETCRQFELGLATLGYFGTEEVWQEGVRITSPNHRVTIPIHNHRGTLVGFTGRQISDSRSKQKYKNSPSSELFDKGSLLFNEHRAMEHARSAGYLVFVEGHFDVISMWQYGIKNVVATQGTGGPPKEALNRFLRQCRRFVLCYDGDAGGQKAIEHFIAVAGPMACSGEVTITVAQMPYLKDPHDCIMEGLDLHGIIESAPQWLDWQIDCWLAGLDRSDTHRFSKVEQAVRDLVSSIRSPALRQYYVDKAAKVLASDPKSAVKLAKSWNDSLPKGRHQARWSPPEPAWVRHQAERRALRSYIHFPRVRDRLRGVMTGLQGVSHLWLWNRILEIEACGGALDQSTVMAILAVGEPHYTRTLRSLAMPTISLTDADGMIEHVERVLSDSTVTIEHP